MRTQVPMETLKLKAVHHNLLCEIENAVAAHHRTMAKKKTNFIFKNNVKHQVTGHLNLPVFPSPVIVKTFSINRWKAFIPYRFYPNPARKAYEVAFKVQCLGITVLDVFGYAVNKRLFTNSRSYLIMTWMLGWIRFDQVLLESSHHKDAYLGYWEIYFRFLKSAAEKGVHHRDMKPGNVLFKKDSQSFCFIDLEDIQIFDGINFGFVAKHFKSIQRWCLHSKTDPQWLLKIQKLYEKIVCNNSASKIRRIHGR